MDKAIKILVEEHKNILKMVDALEKECNEIKSGEKVDEDFFRKIIDFIKNYADKFHHAKEEEILFKEFCKTEEEGCLHCNPVEQMIYEHNLGRDFVKGIEEGITEKNKRKIAENALGYVNLIREHIFKEENILYPMAENVLNKKIKERILKKFNEVEKQKKENKKRYLHFIKSI